MDREAVSPPDAQKVAVRTLCIACLVAKALVIDLEQGRAATQDAAEYLVLLVEWQDAEGLTDLLSPAERELVDKAPAEWTSEEIVNATWRQEAIGVLLWALGAYGELPAYDTEFADVAALVPVLASTEDFVTEAQLRDAREIEHARRIAELWHWRSRTTQLEKSAAPGSERIRAERDLDGIACHVAGIAHEKGDIPEPIGGDFPAFGKAYRRLSDGQYARVNSIALERHLATNWLCGYSDDWDETPTET